MTQGLVRVALAADPRRTASTPWPCAAGAQPRWLQPTYLQPCALVGAGLCGGWQPQRQSTPRSALGEHPRQRFLADPDWDSPAFQQRYADVFSSNYIAELFCQLAWVHDYVDPTAIELPSAEPPFVVPDLLIHCTTARAAKVWPFSYWRQVLDVADANGWSVGLVGSPPPHRRRLTTLEMVKTACLRTLV